MAVRTTPSETATTPGSPLDRFSVVLAPLPAPLWPSAPSFRPPGPSGPAAVPGPRARPAGAGSAARAGLAVGPPVGG